MFSSNDVYEYIYKYIIVGDSGVGKSCLLLQFTNHYFESMHDLTIGVEFGTYMTKYNNDVIKLQIWDTAGQESFKSITRSYYRGAVCALVVFDITNMESFKSVKGWINDVKMYSATPIVILLIGNKCDLTNRRQVSKGEAEKFAEENNIQYLETSAKSSENIHEAFTSTIPTIYKMTKEGKFPEPQKGSSNNVIQLSSKKYKKNDNNNDSYCGC